MRTGESPAAGERAPGDLLSRAHRVSFSLVLAGASRFLILRDRALGWTKRGRVPTGVHERASRHAIPGAAHHPIGGAAHILDAVFVEPAKVPARAAVLLCHGIGETVEQWFGVQQLLAAHGVASLVFDYSGYGKSAGRLHWEQFELDAVAAFAALKDLAPSLPISVLGFSLGSGVAAAAIHRVPAHRLILCEAFTSFRHAAVSIGIPRPLARYVPPIWNAQPPLAECKLPVLIVHGEKDRLFPIAMARELAGWCEPRAEVVVVPRTAHNQPFRKPHISYWGPIIEWIGKCVPPVS
jgi:alpha-beta hydrolase superfamily lysophospholipase